jgi:hypothetical protein
MVPDAMALAACRTLYSQLHQRDRGAEGEDHGRCGRRRGALIPGDGLIMVAEIQTDLPLAHRIHEQSYDCEHGQGRHPCGVLQPHGTERGGILAPATARFHRDMLCLLRLEPLDIRTRFCPQGGGQARPPLRVLRGEPGLWGHTEARAGLNLGGRGLRRTASPVPLVGGADGFPMIVEPMRAPGTRRAAPPSLPTGLPSR